MTSERSAVTMAAILLSAWPTWSWATGVDASTARGGVPGQIYELNGLDGVHLLNGDRTLTIPPGMSYPVGPEFDFQLRLVYNPRPRQDSLSCPIFTATPPGSVSATSTPVASHRERRTRSPTPVWAGA